MSIALQEVQAILNASTEIAIIAADTSNIITVFNKGAEKMLGYTAGEIIGRQTLMLFHLASEVNRYGEEAARECDVDLTGMEALMYKLSRGYADMREWTYTAKNGNLIPVHLTLTAIFNEQHEMTGILGIARDISERRLAEARLRESEEKYRRLFENTIDGVLLTEPDGTVIAANAEACRIFQYTEAELCQLGRDGVIDRYDPRLEAALAERKATGRFKGELTMIRKDGTKFPAELSSSIFKDQAGNEKASIILRDVSEIRTINEYLHAITTASPFGIFVHDEHRGSFYNNLAYTRITGWTLEQLRSSGWTNCIHPEDRAEVTRKWEEARETHSNFEIEHRFIRPDGSVVWASVKAAVIKTANALLGYVGFIEDISERKRLWENMEKNQVMLEEAQHIASLGSWEYEPEYRRISWSAETFRMFGMEPEEGAPSFEQYLARVHPDDVSGLIEAVQGAINNQVKYEMEVRHLLADGTIIHTLGKGRPVVVNGRVKKIIGTVLDITERKAIEYEFMKAKEQAEKAMRAKQEFLSTMSHEIRTPLNAVIGITYLLLQENPRPDQLQNLQTLKFSAENLLVLINDILDFSKIEAGKIVFEEVNFSLKELIRSLKQSHNYLAQEKGINIRIKLDVELPDMVVGDPVRLAQVLNNLLSNAVKFTEKGIVTMEVILQEVTDEGIKVEFTVADTGIGIAEEKLPSIFDSFTQATSDITRRFGGTGLGLAITRQLLQLQGSEIAVESTVGKGSKFSFTLKFKNDPQPDLSAPAQDTPVATTALKGVRLLLVEDNDVNVFVIKKFLETWGIHTDLACNGRIAVEKAEQNVYDIILMDLQMPEMDGYEAARLIRSMEANRATPIVALTASSLPDIRQRASRVGINDYAAKPLNPGELYQKIYRHTRRGV